MEQCPKRPASGTTCVKPRGGEIAGLGCEEAGRHLHGEVGDEGFPGQLYSEVSLLNSIGFIDHTAVNNSMGESGRDPGVHREAVDIDAILGKRRERRLGCLTDTPPSPALHE